MTSTDNTSTRIKIAYIGGGSRNWAIKLMTDLALEPRLCGELALFDIDSEAARYNQALGTALFARPDALGKFTVTAASNAQEAQLGADFVVISIEPGPIEARAVDLLIPLRYGILQTVGDTIGPGGLLRSLRAIPTMEAYGRLIMDTCPNAWVINYTNPMTLCTAALHRGGPGIKAYGCCHEVFGTQERLADLIAKRDGCAAPPRSEIALDIAGVNHFTFATSASYKGQDLLPLIKSTALTMNPRADRTALALERTKKEEWFDSDGAIAFDFFLQYGALGAAGDRHLAEFVPWYLGNEADILCKGVPPTPYEWRLQNWKKTRPDINTLAKQELKPSGEEGVAQMKALLGMGLLKTNVNSPNSGQWTQAPLGSIVESNALFELGNIQPLICTNLPPALASLQHRVITVQSLTLEAALSRDFDLALQALTLDPLNRLSLEKSEFLLKEMLLAAKPWLVGWPTKNLP